MKKLEIEDRRQHFTNLSYAVMGLLLGIIGNIWVYYFSKCLETSFDLTSVHWFLFFLISSGLLSLSLLLLIRYIRRGLRERMPRLLKYSRVIKKIEITNKDGDARITRLYQGKNESKDPISQIRHILRYQSRSAKGGLREDETEVYFDEEKINSRVETYKMQKKSDKIHAFESLLFLDLTRRIEPAQNFSYRIEMLYQKTFKEAFSGEGDFTYYRAHSPTDEISFEILPPPGYVVSLVRKGASPSCTASDWHMILDFAETKRVSEEEPPKKEGSKLVWRIRKPFPSYEYRINFKITRS